MTRGMSYKSLSFLKLLPFAGDTKNTFYLFLKNYKKLDTGNPRRPLNGC
jgi:hypothetical protein